MFLDFDSKITDLPVLRVLHDHEELSASSRRALYVVVIVLRDDPGRDSQLDHRERPAPALRETRCYRGRVQWRRRKVESSRILIRRKSNCGEGTISRSRNSRSSTSMKKMQIPGGELDNLERGERLHRSQNVVQKFSEENSICVAGKWV